MSINELRNLMDEYLATLDDTPDYWDGIFMSEREMASNVFEDFILLLEHQKSD